MRTIQVRSFHPVLAPRVNESLNQLWELIWDVLEGDSDWKETSTNKDYQPFEIYPKWYVIKKTLILSEIYGKLNGFSFEISFIGICKGYIQLKSNELCTVYCFTDDYDYGMFLDFDRKYQPGSCYYYDINLPVKVKMAMTKEKEAEFCEFIDRLCRNIKSYKTSP